MEMEIPKPHGLEQKVFSISNEKEFESIALEVYQFQFANNSLYRNYSNALGKSPAAIQKISQIPFLPISFFKTHQVKTTAFDPELVFNSSGTTGSQTSSHFVKSAGLYKQSFSHCFREFFGDPAGYSILGLLPSYLERKNSSLVFMVDELVRVGGHPCSGFYLDEFQQLARALTDLELQNQKTILFGVTFALLDFGSRFPQQLKHTRIVETGGMKGRSEELTRGELHIRLKSSFGVQEIYSEYGMTELLSQAYGANGQLTPPDHMRVYVRDETDPLSLLDFQTGPVTGAINIIDLANLYSCSFIATDDLGKLHVDGSFEILGRLDNSDIRGCSQLVV